MSPLLKEALRRENAFRAIDSRKPQYELSESMQWGIDHEPEPRKYYQDDFKIDWLDGLGVVFVLLALFVVFMFI